MKHFNFGGLAVISGGVQRSMQTSCQQGVDAAAGTHLPLRLPRASDVGW